VTESAELATTGALLGLLWLREVDAELLDSIATPELRAELATLGLELPASGDVAALDEFAAAYFAAIIHPEDRPPPVHSLIVEGKFEGVASKGIRQIADALGADFDRTASRGAPVDHLGAELTLWSELEERSPASAPAFAQEFLGWAPAWCRQHAPNIPGFYGRLFGLTAEFIDVILDGDRAEPQP